MLDISLSHDAQYSQSHYDTLIEQGQYLDAMHYCQVFWGHLNNWRDPIQLDAAIVLLGHLGRDRDSDAAMLRGWRRFPNNPDFCCKYAFFLVNRLGPIKAELFAEQHHQLLSAVSDATDYLVLQICLQATRKNFVEAKELFAKARELAPNHTWLDRIELMLLRDQLLFDEELALAQSLLALKPRVSLVLDTARAMVRKQQSHAAMQLLAQYAPSMQSCRLWAELINVSARLMEWSQCEQAIAGYRQLQTSPDRDDQDLIYSSLGRIALASGDKTAAIAAFSATKHPYYRQVEQNISQWQGDGQLMQLLAVEHERQGHLTCAPATMAALCRFFGVEASQTSIAEKICYNGTPDSLERQWLRDNGFTYIELDLTPELTFALIDAGLPFALVTTQGFSSHLQAVIGYNRGLGIAYLMDPSRDFTSEIQLVAGLTAEAANGPRAMVFVPQAQAQRLAAFESEVTALYRLYADFTEAREVNQLTKAASLLAQMQQLAPEHRLTLMCHRSIAIEQNDESAIFAANQQLLARYPDHVVWLNSHFQSLVNLGQGENALQYLFDTVKAHPAIDLKIRLFRQIYHMPRYRAETLTLLAELQVSGSYRAEVYDLLADFYWQEKQYQLASRYYFYACCLDDTEQNYVESYYRAALYLQQTDDVFARLQARFDKYGARSASPAKSLFRAFNWQSKAQLGLELLRQARELRPDDQELIIFSLQELLNNGQLADFDQLFLQHKHLLSQSQCWYWLAKKADWQGEHSEATGYYRQCFELTPWQTNVADAYFASLRRCGESDTIIQELEKLAALDPNHPALLNYQADWHPDATAVATAVERLANLFPHYSWYQRRAIRQLMQRGQLAESLHRIEALLALLPHQVENQLLHAQILFQLQQNARAKAQVEQIISQHIDQTDAISLLMDLSVTVAEKRQSLQWLVAELSRQTNQGDAMLELAMWAIRYFDREEQQSLIEVLAANSHVWASRLAWSWLLQQHDHTAALAQLQQAVADFPLLPRLHLELADLAVKLPDDELAAKSYQRALAINPSYSRASRQYAIFLEAQGALAEEIQVLSRAIQYDPTDGVLQGFLGDALLRANEPQQARYALEKAVKFDHHYLWAWHRLQGIGATIGRPDDAYQLAWRLHRESPHLVGPLRALAALAVAPELKIKYWQQSIELEPSNFKLQLPLLEFWLERGQYPQMFDHVNAQFGDGPQPFEIASIMARAYEATGHAEHAAMMLKDALAESNPELKYWEQLFELQRKHKMVKELKNSARLLLARQPNDGLAICTAAEQLLAAGLNDEASELFAKAWVVAPEQRYVALTYLDDLLDKNDFDYADFVVQKLLEKHQDVWVLQRQLKVLLGQNNTVDASKIWHQLIAAKIENLYLYDNAAVSFPKHAQMLMQQLAEQLGSAGRMAGYCLGRWQQRHDPKRVIELLANAGDGQGWNGLYEVYLEDFAARAALPPANMLDPYINRITADPSLSATLGNIYRVNGRLYQAVKTYSGIQAQQRPCFVSYHYGTTLADLNRWDDALRVLTEGAEAEPDNCFHNLQLWRIAAEFLRTGDVSANLSYVNRQELTEIELLVLECLHLVLHLPNYDGNELIEQMRVIKHAGGKDAHIKRVRKVADAMFSKVSEYQPEYSLVQRLQLMFYRFWLF